MNTMENSGNYRYGSVTRELPFLLTFKILVGIMAVMITVTSSFLINEEIKSRYNVYSIKHIGYWSWSNINASVRRVKSSME